MSNKPNKPNKPNNTSNKGFLVGTVIGGVVGAATALLLAPKSGKEFRSDLNEQAAYVRLKTEQAKNSAVEKDKGLLKRLKKKQLVYHKHCLSNLHK
ncbi:YtxH domain-containing protein [Priestia megaterium]